MIEFEIVEVPFFSSQNYGKVAPSKMHMLLTDLNCFYLHGKDGKDRKIELKEKVTTYKYGS